MFFEKIGSNMSDLAISYHRVLETVPVSWERPGMKMLQIETPNLLEKKMSFTPLCSYWNSPMPATLPAYTNRIPWDQEAYFIIT